MVMRGGGSGLRLWSGPGFEEAVVADEFAVEVDRAAAVLGALDIDHVPVDLGAVAIVGQLVGLAGGEVEGAADFLVEEDVAHRLEDVGIEGEGELADEAGAFVGIEDFVQAPGVAAGGVDDLCHP